jgi:aarF domain-containing kinase
VLYATLTPEQDPHPGIVFHEVPCSVLIRNSGNLLIRPSPPTSKSPYNFEIVLLDHGLYFDIDQPLRINYSKLWLSLIAPASPSTTADRREYAKLVGNIGPDLVSLWFQNALHGSSPLQYPVFEAAITGLLFMESGEQHTYSAIPGRAALESFDESDAKTESTFRRASSMIDMLPQTEEEMQAIRDAVASEGLLLSVFDVLRRVPRRVLMVLKLNDLTR